MVVDGRGVSAGERAAALQALFERIAATRMAGVPIVHPALAVRAVGFEAASDGRGAIGILVTPWFMNLVWLALANDARSLPVGEARVRWVGRERFAFIGAEEPGFGPFEACSLFSPMYQFADQAAAVATAEAVLRQLRAPGPEPGRRALLLGGRHGARA
jgi:[NiFe] hydrogenase assembly HybE family chaperone